MRTIDILTAQNVTIEYELASLKERFFAFFIDCVVVFAGFMLIFWVAVNVMLGESSDFIFVLLKFLPIIMFIGYQFFSEVLADGQSLGKRAVGIKVVRIDGKEPGLSDYSLRAVFHLIDTLLSSGVIAALLISSTIKRQRLGDMTANTTVIKIKFSLRFRLQEILKINTLENYSPSYAQVTQLSETDMLLIKSVISRYQTYKNTAHREIVQSLVHDISDKLDIEPVPEDKIGFLKTLIKDYIVLTR